MTLPRRGVVESNNSSVTRSPSLGGRGSVTVLQTKIVEKKARGVGSAESSHTAGLDLE